MAIGYLYEHTACVKLSNAVQVCIYGNFVVNKQQFTPYLSRTKKIENNDPN